MATTKVKPPTNLVAQPRGSHARPSVEKRRITLIGKMRSYQRTGPGAEMCAREKSEAPVLDVILKQFDKPDEVRHFEKGKFELVHIGGMTIGRATYAPG